MAARVFRGLMDYIAMRDPGRAHAKEVPRKDSGCCGKGMRSNPGKWGCDG